MSLQDFKNFEFNDQPLPGVDVGDIVVTYNREYDRINWFRDDSHGVPNGSIALVLNLSYDSAHRQLRYHLFIPYYGIRGFDIEAWQADLMTLEEYHERKKS